MEALVISDKRAAYNKQYLQKTDGCNININESTFFRTGQQHSGFGSG